MQTLTINVDDRYLDQILDFLQNIPKNKREIFHHQKIDISNSKAIVPNNNIIKS